MSDDVAAEAYRALGGNRLTIEAYPGRQAQIGDLTISRILPVRDRRLVGPWCFLDRFGPLTFSGGKPLDVAPHPHIGLQTVTWLLDGEIVHDDSLGFKGLAAPGGVNVMTAGAGIAHAEQTPRTNSGRLNGVQLWTALPDVIRNGRAGFQHVAQVPMLESPGGIARVFAGSLGGVTSPAVHHSPLVGAELQIHPGDTMIVDAPRTFEHAVLLLDGDAASEDASLAQSVLYYFSPGRTELAFASRSGARLLVIGGLPFEETSLMWWNFVARTPAEIASARTDWEAGLRFGTVGGHGGAPIPAPALARFARPNPVS
jgi:hypothetical protein